MKILLSVINDYSKIFLLLTIIINKGLHVLNYEKKQPYLYQKTKTPFLLYKIFKKMKTKQLKNNVLQVFCQNLQQQLQALVMYPNYLFEVKGENWETFLYFKIK